MQGSKLCFVLMGLIVLLIGSSAVANGASALSGAEPARANPDLLDFSKLEAGDILLRKGRSYVSELISMGFGSQVSHCGLILQDEGKWKVLHIISGQISEQNSIRLDPIESFIQEALPGSVYQLKPVQRPSVGAIEQESRSLLLARPSFDHQFDLSDESELYCSELVRLIYLKSGSQDLFHYKTIGGKRLIDMDSFFDSKFFQLCQAL